LCKKSERNFGQSILLGGLLKMTEKKQYPAEEGLFTWPSDQPQLIGGKCKACNTYYFPKTDIRHKPDCTDRRATEDTLFSRKGKLDSFTIQYYQPPPPSPNPVPFAPYPIGWVSLPEGIAIPGIITGCELEEVKMHMDVELVVEAGGQDKEGNDVLIWKWRKI
jgi:uncharacterized OB-fold protein